jgi:hypothetical protein
MFINNECESYNGNRLGIDYLEVSNSAQNHRPYDENRGQFKQKSGWI